MRAAGYIRVSTTEQVEEGHSLDDQPALIAEFCRSKGWELVGVYEDAAISGSRSDRPALRRLLADAEAGAIDVVVVKAIERFFRNLNGLTNALARLNKAGVGFVSIRENMDFTTPAGKIVLAVMGVLAEVFLDIHAQSVSTGKRGRVRRGLSNASHAPYGYQRGDDGDQVDPAAAEAVVLAFETYAGGKHSDTKIAGLLNRMGYEPSGRARSGRWTREGVRYMLNNAFYAGQVRRGDKLYPGTHVPIISQEIFDQVQAVRARRKPPRPAMPRQRGAAGRSPDGVYLMGRLARCSICGLRLLSQTSGGKGRRGTPTQYYQCPARRRSIDCEVGGKYTPAADVDAEIGDLVMRLKLPDDWRDRLEELAEHREEQENIEGRRRYLQGKLRRLRNLYIEGDFGKGEYNRRKADLTVQLDALRAPERPAIEAAGETLESLADAWEGAPVRLRAEMLKTIFESVVIDVAARRLVCVKPYPPFVPLFRMDGLSEKEGCFYVDEEEQEAGSEG